MPPPAAAVVTLNVRGVPSIVATTLAVSPAVADDVTRSFSVSPFVTVVAALE
ncbi:hypothetical protein AAIO73_10775 [Sphingomonas sp. T9W2]